MDNSDITLKCMNGFTLHIKGANLIVEAKRKEDPYPISKIQSRVYYIPHGASRQLGRQFRPWHQRRAWCRAELFLHEIRIKHSNPDPGLCFKLRRRKDHCAGGQGCFCR